MNLADCPDLLRVEEAADILRVSKNRVYDEIAAFGRTAGRTGLPAVRIGRVLRVPKESLLDWIEAQVSAAPVE